MSHSTSRVLAMLELLQAHHRLTGVELAGRLSVDERTVRRYATALAELGIPVTAARGRYGGYRLTPGYKLPPLMLNDDEAVAVVLGLIAADRLGLATEAPATGVALAKIHRMLPPPLAVRLDAMRSTLGFTPRPRGGDPRPATVILSSLATATSDHRRTTLSHRSARGDPIVREFDPYGLVFHGGRWYVTGHDHLDGEVHTFRLDRVTSVDVGQTRFTVPEGFDPVGQVTRSSAGVAYRWEVEVLLEADLTQARQRLPANVAELTETADGILLRTRVRSLPDMARLLAGLGWSFTIVRPDELRLAVRELAERLAVLARR